MEVEGLLKVGIAVKDVDKAYANFVNAFGLPAGGGATFEPLQMRYETCYLGDVMIEFMESTTPDGPLARFIRRHWEGMQHLSVKVSNLEEAVVELKAKGIEFLNETPMEIDESAVGKGWFVFASPRSFNGVLVQLIELLKNE